VGSGGATLPLDATLAIPLFSSPETISTLQSFTFLFLPSVPDGPQTCEGVFHRLWNERAPRAMEARAERDLALERQRHEVSRHRGLFKSTPSIDLASELSFQFR